MPYVRTVHANEILDSRGNPTIEVTIETDHHIIAKASVPSGASTGKHEARESRDGDRARYFGNGVLQAVAHVMGPIAQILVGEHVFDQRRLDAMLIEADGTENKERFGANAILATSMALARVGALTAGLPLFRYLGGCGAYTLPCPMVNIINGGEHSDNLLDFQEFMIRPCGAPTFSEAIRWCAEIFHTLKGSLKKRGLVTAVGDEGGFAPNFTTPEEALEIIVESIEKAGYRPGEQVTVALDCAASEFYDPIAHRYFEKKQRAAGKGREFSSEELIDYLAQLCQKFPIDSIEDGLAEDDWSGWVKLTEKLGYQIQLVGDDIFVTNPKFLLRGIHEGVGNAILIKLNQIGTVSETLETIQLAQRNSYRTVVSHRSGETEDTFIADLAVATNSGQIKTGSMCRSERLAKYNRLLNIEKGMKEGRYRDGCGFKCCQRQTICTAESRN